MSVEWVDPPPVQPTRVQRVAAELRSKPGEWTRIDAEAVFGFFPWWARLADSAEFEVKIVLHDRGLVFGLRDVYARALPQEDM